MIKAVTLAACAAVAFGHGRSTFSAEEFPLVARPAARGVKMTFGVALPQQNIAQLEKELYEISDPRSARYGQWKTMEEVRALTAPSAEVRAEVRGWLAAGGAECVDTHASLRCTATVENVEELFHTEISEFGVADKPGSRLFRVHPHRDFAMPAHLAGKALFLTQVYDFPTRRMRHGSHAPVAASGALRGLRDDQRRLSDIPGRRLTDDRRLTDTRRLATPPSDRRLDDVGRRLQSNDLYIALESVKSIYSISATGSKENSAGPAEFQGLPGVTQLDLDAFAKNNGIPNWKIDKTVGPNIGTNTESVLDEEYVAGVGVNNTQWFWTEADWIYDWTEKVKVATATPSVFSVSYGWWDLDNCDPNVFPQPDGVCTQGSTQALAIEYVQQTNANLLQITSTGITILVSSGDAGAHGRTDEACSSHATRADWPGSSPYVLAVGGTQLTKATPIKAPTTPFCTKEKNKCAGSGVEIMSSTKTGSLITSGGGFSDVAPQPSYQTAAVAAYLASNAVTPGAGNFNSSNRAYPDVAGFAHNVIVYQGGQAIPVDGTSCSTPIFSGIISLANAARIAAGKKTLGFINPAIYSIGAAGGPEFTDISGGQVNNCGDSGGCVPGCTGFGTVKGWDATTGWGTPNTEALIKALLAL